MQRTHDFARDELAPSWWANRVQDAISLLASNFRLTQLNATTLRVPGAADAAAVIVVQGKWRWSEANVDRAHPGGAAGTYDVFVTARAQAVDDSPAVATDHTDYAFGLAIVAAGSTPPIVAGTVDLFRKVGTCGWDGAAITRVDPSVETPWDAEPSDGPAAQATRRTLGAGPRQAVAGDDPRLTDSRIPTGVAGGDLAGTYPNPSIKASVALTGNPTAPTPAADDNDTSIATTAFVLGQHSTAIPQMDAGAGGAGGSTRFSPADHVHPSDTSRAPLASPALTGAPTAPTPAIDTNTTRIATTAFVLGQLSAAGDGVPLMNGAAARGVSLHGARADHVHPVDTSRAPVSSPVFDGNIQFGAAGSGGHLNSFTPPYALLRSNYWAATDRLVDTTRPTWSIELDGRAGFDYLRVLRAPATAGAPADAQLLTLSSAGLLTVASVAVTTFSGTPNFSGAATGQTAAPGDNTTKLATTAFVLANGTQLGSSTPLMDGAAAVGTATSAAHADHRHPTDTSRAPIASPTFTGDVSATGNLYGNNALTLGGDVNLYRQQAGVGRMDRSLVIAGGTSPSALSGLELKWQGAAGGQIEAYDRGAGVSRPLNLYGSPIGLNAATTTASGDFFAPGPSAVRLTGGSSGRGWIGFGGGDGTVYLTSPNASRLQIVIDGTPRIDIDGSTTDIDAGSVGTDFYAGGVSRMRVSGLGVRLGQAGVVNYLANTSANGPWSSTSGGLGNRAPSAFDGLGTVAANLALLVNDLKQMGILG